jgi:alkylation response protein AidB-like acyl-CoA dehydrogenase
MTDVDLALTDDQEMLREATARFVQTACPMTLVRELGESGADIGEEYLRSAAELGWFAMLVPEALGGGSVSGAGLLDAAVLAEERGRLLQPLGFVAANVVADTLARVGSDEQRATALGAIVAAEARVAWAIADAAGEWGAPGVRSVTKGDDQLVLDGTASLVQDADVADWLLVTTVGDTGSVQVLVAAGTAGVSVRARTGLDIRRRFADVVFDGVTVRSSSIVGEPGGAAAAVERQFDVAAVLTVAESVGAMDAIFGTTVEYAKVRTAFGRPIGSFQAIKHLLADTSLALEQSKAIATAAARAVQAESADASEVASMAKSFVGEAGIELAQNCWQAFGGIAYTWEHDLHLFLRRLTADASLYGEPAWHRERICRIHGL